MKRENYINIQGWMVKDLKLSGHKLIIYALIYGFSQDGKSTFNGSYEYISSAVNLSRRSTVRNINSLIQEKLVTKVHHKKGNSYKVVTKCHHPSDKSSPVASDKMSPNNNIYNNIVYTDKSVGDVSKKYSPEEELKKLGESKRKDQRIIGYYFKRRKMKLPTEKVFKRELLRALAETKTLKDFENKKIIEAFNYAEQNYPEWTIETVGKVITKI